jgi:hypothetical protein
MSHSKEFNKALDLCRKAASSDFFSFEKKALMGSDGQDSQFEQAFSNLAHAYVKDKAPTLLDYEVGFQLLDRNDDNTKATGMFGFKVGKQWLYAPVFFLNGDMKGTELLYLKDQDQFVPLIEDWLNYILQRKPAVLGDTTDRNLQRLGVLSPDLQSFSRPPAKYASAGGMEKGAEAFAYFSTYSPFTDPKYKDLPTFPDFLKSAGLSMVESFIKLGEAYPALMEAAVKIYGMDTIKESIKEAAKKIKWIKQQIVGDTEPEDEEAPLKPKGVLEAYNGHVTQKVIRKNAEKLEILTAKTIEQRGVDLEPSDLDKENIITEGFSVKDERPEAAVAYEIQTKLSLTNPSETGIFDLMVGHTKFSKCLVVLGPITQSGSKTFATIVDLDSKEYINTHPGNVWARERATQKDEYADLTKGLPKIGSKDLAKGKFYMILEDGVREGSCPFRIVDKISSDDAETIYEVEFKDYSYSARPAALPDLKVKETYWGYGKDRDSDGMGCCSCYSKLHVTNKVNGGIRNLNGELYVPGDYKVFAFKDVGEYESPTLNDSYFAKELDLTKAIYEKTAKLEVRHTGTVVSINGYEFDKVAAVIHLIKGWHLREKQAKDIVKNAALAKVVSYRVMFPESFGNYMAKTAAPGDPMDPNMQGITAAPPFPSQPVGVEPAMLNSVAAQYPQQESVPAFMQTNSMSNQQIYDPRMPDVNAIQTAMQAAQTGQKEILDTSMIGSLLNNNRDDSMIDKHIGTLMAGLDRIGRILFSFYQHGEKFSDRYGDDDIEDLEEKLRDAFEAMGKLTIYLKQRSVEPMQDEGFDGE